MDKENNKMKYFEKLIFKLIITGIALFVSYIVSIYLLIIFNSLKINVISTVWSALLLPTLLLILIYSKNKKRNLKRMSSQAVGGAVGWNPICIIIPCHRVVGANGSLTGYGGGIKNKIELLKLEGNDMRKYFVPKKGTAL